VKPARLPWRIIMSKDMPNLNRGVLITTTLLALLMAVVFMTSSCSTSAAGMSDANPVEEPVPIENDSFSSSKQDAAVVRARVPGSCCGLAMVQIIQGFQELGVYDGFALLEVSAEDALFQVTYEQDQIDQEAILKIIRDAGGTVTQ
jgi:hypothetical protein